MSKFGLLRIYSIYWGRYGTYRIFVITYSLLMTYSAIINVDIITWDSNLWLLRYMQETLDYILNDILIYVEKKIDTLNKFLWRLTSCHLYLLWTWKLFGEKSRSSYDKNLTVKTNFFANLKFYTLNACSVNLWVFTVPQPSIHLNFKVANLNANTYFFWFPWW